MKLHRFIFEVIRNSDAIFFTLFIQSGLLISYTDYLFYINLLLNDSCRYKIPLTDEKYSNLKSGK